MADNLARLTRDWLTKASHDLQTARIVSSSICFRPKRGLEETRMKASPPKVHVASRALEGGK